MSTFPTVFSYDRDIVLAYNPNPEREEDSSESQYFKSSFLSH